MCVNSELTIVYKKLVNNCSSKYRLLKLIQLFPMAKGTKVDQLTKKDQLLQG